MNTLQRSKLFSDIWEIWPNKDKEFQARKALKVLCAEEDIDPSRLIAAANIYCLELRSEHCHELGNWIRNDVWKDIYSEFKEIFDYEKKLKDERDEAVKVISHWKNNRLEWWCSIESIEDHINQVKHALKNVTFKKRWKDGFDILLYAFKERAEDGWKSRITPSISWFCKTDYDSSTISRIIEGEFGYPRKRKKFNAANLFPKRDQMPRNEAKKKIKDILMGKVIPEKDKSLDKPKNNMDKFLSKIKKDDKRSKYFSTPKASD